MPYTALIPTISRPMDAHRRAPESEERHGPCALRRPSLLCAWRERCAPDRRDDRRSFSTASRRRCPTTRRWSRVHQGVRYTYREFQARCDRFARGLMALGVAQGRPDRHLVAELCRVGRRAVRRRRRSARSWSTSTPPTASTSWSTRSVNPAARALIIAPPFKTSDYAAMLQRRLPRARRRATGQSARRARCRNCGR